MCSRWIYLKSERERERAVECCVRASVKHAALQVSPSCRDWLATDKSAPPSVMSIRRHQQLDSCSSVLPLEMSLQFSTPYSIYRLYSRSCMPAPPFSLITHFFFPFFFLPKAPKACFVSLLIFFLSPSIAAAVPSNLELYLDDGGPNRLLVRANERLNAQSPSSPVSTAQQHSTMYSLSAAVGCRVVC